MGGASASLNHIGSKGSCATKAVGAVGTGGAVGTATIAPPRAAVVLLGDTANIPTRAPLPNANATTAEVATIAETKPTTRPTIARGSDCLTRGSIDSVAVAESLQLFDPECDGECERLRSSVVDCDGDVLSLPVLLPDGVLDGELLNEDVMVLDCDNVSDVVKDSLEVSDAEAESDNVLDVVTVVLDESDAERESDNVLDVLTEMVDVSEAELEGEVVLDDVKESLREGEYDKEDDAVFDMVLELLPLSVNESVDDSVSDALKVND